MSEEKPPMPPGLPPMPPGLPPMPPMPPGDAPPAPPGMPPMPPMPPGDAPPAPPGMPPMPPMPPMGDVPPAPPEMPPMPPMPPMGDAPPAPPEMPPMPPMPPMGDAPPAPPEMPPMPPMGDAPPAPPEMPPMPESMEEAEEEHGDEPMEVEEEAMADAPDGDEAPAADPLMDPLAMPPAPPAPPEMPPMPPMPEAPAADPLMDPLAMPPAPPAPPEMPPMPPMPEAPAADPLMDPLAMPPAPPAPPEMPPMPPMPEAPAADPLMDPLAMPPAPPAPPEMPSMPPMPEAPAADPLMDPLAMPPAPPAPPEMPPMPPMPDALSADPLMDPLAAPPAPPSEALLDPLAPALDAAPLPDLAPADLTGEQAGATIRSLADVEAVLGDKLEGTLHEVESTTLNAEGVIIKQSVKGTLTVNNPSADDRIYDIDVLLDNIGATDIGGEHVSVDELEPTKSHTMAYKVSGKQMMTLRERLDTNPSRSQERSLSVAIGEDPGPLALELEVENLSGVELHDVVVTRPLADEMHFEMVGGAEIEDGVITWTVGRLQPGEKQTLSMEGTINVTSSKAISGGKATATYRADATVSSMSFRELDAFCRGFTYMRVTEDERPDNWKCRAIFENRSSFAVDLTKLQVRMKGSEDLLFDIHDVDQDVTPNGKWESEERTVMAQSEPDFTYDLSYTVLPRALQTSEGSMTLEEKKLDVLEASVSKTYSTGNLRSYRSQKVQANMTLKNEGSATINLMRVTDDLPGLFEVPSAEQLTIKLDGKAIDDDQFKVEISEGLTIEKEHRSPDGQGHTMTLTIGTRGPLGLKPGKKIEISYPLTAPDPSPGNERVDAPARVEFSAERFGPICTREPESSPSIRVIHNRRNFSAGKQAIPLGGKGRYEVLILFENNGDTALSDLYINDVLPPQFEIKEWEMKSAGGKREDVTMTSEDGEGGLHIVWHVPKVEKGERLEVSFDIKGSGEVDAEALNRFHGVHFGDEIESDDLPALEDDSADEASEEESDEVADESNGVQVKFREDMLLRVMEAAGIDVAHRDEFVAFAADFDHDENGYLKKSELEDAAHAWNNQDSGEEGADGEEPSNDSGDEVEAEAAPTAEEAEVEEVAQEDAPAEAESAEVADEKACLICSTANAADATVCSACGYTWE